MLLVWRGMVIKRRYILNMVGGVKLNSIDFSQNKIISFVLARSRIDKLRTMGVAH